MSEVSRMLAPERSLLLVIDIQEKFVPVIPGYERLVARTGILIQACNRLEVPVIVSEQYPKGLGHTVPELQQVLAPDTAVMEKTAFGCGGDPAILGQIFDWGRKQIMVCGIEAHVCVNQTVHQLLSEGYQVHLMRDAIASRNPDDAGTAFAKMTQSGAIPGCVEMALFEMMTTARHPGFKELQTLVK
jgi:nicotinamidase-related amidase